VAALSSRAVGGNGGIVLCYGKAHISRCGSQSKHVLHASTQAEHCSPTQNDVYGVYIDGMLRAGKLRVWKQWAIFHQGLGV
jgi:hypothetical protein